MITSVAGRAAQVHLLEQPKDIAAGGCFIASPLSASVPGTTGGATPTVSLHPICIGKFTVAARVAVRRD
jgi:hypothetical protein